MKIIYTYPLQLQEEQTLTLPLNAQILSVQWIHGKVCMFALVDYDEFTTEPRKFEIFGTGTPITPQSTPAERYFLGTVVSDDQKIVCHVFEKKNYEDQL